MRQIQHTAMNFIKALMSLVGRISHEENLTINFTSTNKNEIQDQNHEKENAQANNSFFLQYIYLL